MSQSSVVRLRKEIVGELEAKKRAPKTPYYERDAAMCHLAYGKGFGSCIEGGNKDSK